MTIDDPYLHFLIFIICRKTDILLINLLIFPQFFNICLSNPVFY